MDYLSFFTQNSWRKEIFPKDKSLWTKIYLWKEKTVYFYPLWAISKVMDKFYYNL